MHRLFIVVTMLLAAGAGAQNITWKTSGATLPKGAYTLHTSRDGELYAFGGAPTRAVYRYIASAQDWRKVADGSFGKLQVISNDLAYAFETTIETKLVRFTNDFKEMVTIDASIDLDFRPRDFAIGPDSSIYLIGIDYADIFCSKDLGATWEILPASADMIFNGLNVDAKNTLYAWNTEGRRSTDGGQTFEMIHYFHKGDAPAKCLTYSDSVYILTHNGILYREFDTLGVVVRPYASNVWSGTLVEIGINKTLYYHPPNGYGFVSHDEGTTWDTMRMNGMPLSPGPSLTCDSSGNIYSASDEKIFVSSDNGSTWSILTHFKDKFSIIGSDATANLYAKNQQQLYRSADDGHEWTQDILPNVRYVYSATADGNGEIFAICRDSSNEVILGTKASPQSAWAFTSPMPFQDATTPYLVSGRLPSGELWSVDAEGFFSVLETNGTWRNSFVLDVPSNDVVTAQAINSTTFVVAGFQVIYRSTDKGKTFRKVHDLMPSEVGRVIASNANASYVLTNQNRLYFSTDSGKIWEVFKTPQDTAFTDIVTQKSGAIYISSATSVYRNLSGFSNPLVWEDISNELKGLSIANLILRGNKRLYAVTSEGNVYFTDLPGSSVSTPEEDAFPIVYPNPGSNWCYLHGVGESAEVEIYNLLGTRVLQTLYQGKLDVSKLPAGVYQIIAGNSRANLVIHR